MPPPTQKKSTRKPSDPSNSKPCNRPHSLGKKSSMSKAPSSFNPPHTSTPISLPLPLIQHLLTTFSTAFSPLLSSTNLPTTIQTLKHHLYARDFASAFGDQEALEAYSARWSAGRAVAYTDVLAGLLRGRLWGETDGSWPRRKVLCLGGGGGAEVVALAGLASWLKSRGGVDEGEFRELGLDITVIDTAAWDSCIQKLVDTMVTPPPVSAYASASVKASNRALIDPGALSCKFLRRDIIADVGGAEMRELCEGVGLVTMMFTLNELYTTSVAKTTRFLLELTGMVGKGCLLLVLDSPGSYSTVRLKEGRETQGSSREGNKGDGKVGERAGKKYPMHWLLDHTLLDVGCDGEREKEGKGKKWENLYEEDSRWFRLKDELRYPIKLEDMRMQVHLYRRI